MKLKIRGVLTPKVLIPVIALAGIGFGTATVINLLNRKGEAAIKLIPADAAIAVSFDNTPSAAQVPLFTEIKQAMEDSGLNQMIEDGLTAADGGKGVLNRLRSTLQGSFALGVWGDLNGSEPEAVLCLSLNDPGQAENIVQNFGKRIESNGIPIYKGEDKGLVAFYKEYALISNSERAIARVVSVGNGESQSLYEQQSFKDARASLPEDATFMTFVNCKAIVEKDKDAKQGFEALGLNQNGWLAYGVTMRPDGIHIDGTMPNGLDENSIVGMLRSMGPLKFNSISQFPSGAIGVMGLSNPSKILEMVRNAVNSKPEEAKAMEEGIAQFEKESQLSIENDILPALRGEINVALYKVDGAKDPSVILSLDESNGGTAVATLQKVINKVNSGAYDNNGNTPRFVESQNGPFKVYTPNGGEKVIFAIGNDEVFIVSDLSLINKLQSGERLSSDGAFANLQSNKDSLMSLTIDLEKVIDLINAEGKPQDVDLRQLITQPKMTASWSVVGDTARFEMLLPIDIPSVIRTVGKQIK